MKLLAAALLLGLTFHLVSAAPFDTISSLNDPKLARRANRKDIADRAHEVNEVIEHQRGRARLSDMKELADRILDFARKSPKQRDNPPPKPRRVYEMSRHSIVGQSRAEFMRSTDA